MVGDSITEAVIQVLNTSQLPPSLNHTLVTLIPKKNHVVKVVDFSLIISLCNVIYKLISKTIANRLKIILSQIVSDSHSTFVLRRQITNNILVVYENFHFLRKKKGKQGFISIKLYMSKAYNRVE